MYGNNKMDALQQLAQQQELRASRGVQLPKASKPKNDGLEQRPYVPGK